MMTIICVKGGEAHWHAFLFAITFACLSALTSSGESVKPWENFDWFSWVKRFSLLAGWIIMFILWLFARIDHKSTKTKIARRIF